MTKSFAKATPVKMLMHPVNDQGGGNYRILQPASLLRRNGYAVAQAHRQHVSSDALAILDPDVVVFQMFQTEQQIDTIKRYRKTLPHARFVYEIDDLFWAVPEGSVHHNNNPLLATSKTNIRMAAKLCDAIVCSTDTLAGEMKMLTGMRDIRVVPNELPRSFINNALAGRRSAEAKRSDKPRVGWAGGVGHGPDLKIIGEVAHLLGDEVQWVFFGMVPPGVDPKNVEAYGGVPFNDYAFALGTLNLDLALAPLVENDFNRCKSDLRILEYGAAGFPVIASDVSTYTNSPVQRCENTAEAWAAAIRSVLAAPEELRASAERLHEWVTATRCMDDHLGARLAGFLPRNAEPFIPMSRVSDIGKLVTVGIELDCFESYPSVQEAWKNSPGADILYVRKDTVVTPDQALRVIEALGVHASVSTITNDGVYPVPGRFMRLSQKVALQIDVAARIMGQEPIPAPFPSGPCVVLSGSALARFGLPDEDRFGQIEFAMGEWGARCCEGGRTHVTAANTFIHTEEGLQQVPNLAKKALDHLALWVPGFIQFVHAYQVGEPLAAVRENLELAFNSLFHEKLPFPTQNYTEWADAYDSISLADREAMAADIATWESKPHISIVMPTFNTPEAFLIDAIKSVMGQAYENWSLLIADDASTEPHVRRVLDEYSHYNRVKVAYRSENGHICKASNTALEMASYGWVVFLDHDDMLAPHALYMIAREIREHPTAEFIYSDSDKMNAAGARVDPYYAPDFSYELLLAQNYVTHLSAYRVDGVRNLGGLMPGMEGSQDWDLTLRYLEAKCGTPPNPALIRHIPEVLYHWRQAETSTASNIMNKPYAVDAGRKAVMHHLQRTKQPAFVGQNPAVPIFNLVRFLVPDPAPKVTILVPTKDNPDQLTRCIGSLLANTVYGNFDVIVMDNGSAQRDTKELLAKLAKTPRVRVLRIPGQFNYAAMNNQAAKHTDAEFLCLLNDDTEIIERAWLNDMVGLAMREMVGAVGAKLLYPDNSVQQCGIMFSPDQTPGYSSMHMWQKLAANAPGQAGRAVITQPVMAVTGACMVIRRSLYEAYNGLDETTFPVDYNDVDLCIRLHKDGYRNIVSAQAVVRHHEGQTKRKLKTWKRDDMIAAEQRLLALHHDVRDPYVNPNMEFHPSLSTLVNAPAQKVWRSDNRRRVLLVNGRENEAKQSFHAGDLPFCASLEGHYLTFTLPLMQHVQPVDLRQDTNRIAAVLGALGIDHITFCGIGDGTLGSVGFFTKLAEFWPMDFTPTEQAKTTNEHDYYTADGWDSVWERFLETIGGKAWLDPVVE